MGNHQRAHVFQHAVGKTISGIVSPRIRPMILVNRSLLRSMTELTMSLYGPELLGLSRLDSGGVETISNRLKRREGVSILLECRTEPSIIYCAQTDGS